MLRQTGLPVCSGRQVGVLVFWCQKVSFRIGLIFQFLLYLYIKLAQGAVEGGFQIG